MPDDDRLVSAWRKLALIEYPDAAKFAELVTGSTEDDIRESARAVHEPVQELRYAGADGFDQVRQQARFLWSRPQRWGHERLSCFPWQRAQPARNPRANEVRRAV